MYDVKLPTDAEFTLLEMFLKRRYEYDFACFLNERIEDGQLEEGCATQEFLDRCVNKFIELRESDWHNELYSEDMWDTFSEVRR